MAPVLKYYLWMAAVCKSTNCEWLQCVKIVFVNGCSVEKYYLWMAAVYKYTICECLLSV